MADGGAGMAGAGMQIAGNIFNEMVMEEAIKDKTRQVQKEMEEAEAEDDEVVPATTFQHLNENGQLKILFTRYGGHNGFIENYRFEDFSIKIAFQEINT